MKSKNVTLQVGNFGDILETAQTPQNFVYFDPPYYPICPTNNFNRYSRYLFSDRE